jgi:hypothetical protein
VKKVRQVKTFIPEFLKEERLTSAQLERASRTSRQAMTQIRAGRDVRLSTMHRILAGARREARRAVEMKELWDLNPPEDDQH